MISKPTGSEKPSGYNPCVDGLAAKIWECLRRNAQFRVALTLWRAKYNRWRAGCGKSKKREDFLFFPETENRFARHIFGIELRYNTDGNIEKTTWTNLSPEFRQSFQDIVEIDFKPSASEVPRPPIEYLARPTKYGCWAPIATTRAINYVLASHLNICEEIWRDYIVVAIPKYVRDTDHRNAIVEFLTRRVAPARVRSRALTGKRGKLFGTVADWDVYLFYEWLRGHSIGDVYIEPLMAWKFYESSSWTDSKIKEISQPEIFAQAKAIHARRKDKIRAHMDAISSAIGSVYPRFPQF